MVPYPKIPGLGLRRISWLSARSMAGVQSKLTSAKKMPGQKQHGDRGGSVQRCLSSAGRLWETEARSTCTAARSCTFWFPAEEIGAV
jgi:hypothetical protein